MLTCLDQTVIPCVCTYSPIYPFLCAARVLFIKLDPVNKKLMIRNFTVSTPNALIFKYDKKRLTKLFGPKNHTMCLCYSIYTGLCAVHVLFIRLIPVNKKLMICNFTVSTNFYVLYNQTFLPESYCMTRTHLHLKCNNVANSLLTITNQAYVCIYCL